MPTNLHKQLFAGIFAVHAVSCGVDNEFETAQISSAIISGSVDSDDRYSGVVQVKSTVGSCSGTLIDRNWVLTAAHCLCNRIQIGTTNQDSSSWANCNTNVTLILSRQTQSVVRTAQAIAHPTYYARFDRDKDTVLEIRDDMALVRLAEAAPALYAPISVLMPERLRYQFVAGPEPRAKPPATLVGFGFDTCTRIGLPTGTRRYGTTTEYSGNGVSDTVYHHGGNINSVAAASGDSGGPMIVSSPMGYVATGPVVIGVFSRGVCSKLPMESIYTTTARYSDWIHQTTQIPYNAATAIYR